MKRNTKSRTCLGIQIYIIMMILGMLISEYFVLIDRTTTFWIVNILGFAIFCFYVFSSNKNYQRIGYNSFILAVIYLICCAICLIFHSSHILDSTKSIGLNINIIVVAINIIIMFNARNFLSLTKTDIISIMQLIFIIGLLSTFYAIFIEGFSFSALANANNIYNVASSSFFDNKNTYGAFTFFTLISGIYLFYNTRHKILVVLALIIQIFSLVISFSRASLLAFAVFFICFYCMLLSNRINKKSSKKEKKINRIIVIASILCVVLVALIILLNQSLLDFLIKNVIRSDFGDAGRDNIWNYVIQFMEVEDYFFGIGYSDLNATGISYVHNIYLEVFIVGGIAKSIIYLIVLIYAFVRLKKSSKSSLISRLGLSCFVAYLVYGYFESQIILELGIIPFLFVLFIYILPAAERKEEIVIK